MDSGSFWVVADAYDRYMGRWSRLVAARFAGWVPPGGRWVEVGCGIGALTEALLG